MEQQRQTTGSAVARWGVSFGVALGILSALQTAFTFLGRTSDIAALAQVVIFILGLAAFFVAGILASRETGTVSTGAFAGLVTALVATLISGLVLIGIAAFAPRAYADAAGFMQLGPRARVLFLLATLTVLLRAVIVGGFGAALGALGGLVGSGGAQPTPPPS